MSLPPVEIPLGAIRFNSDSQKLEYFNGDVWMQVHTFNPDLDGGVRGVFMGGDPGSGTADAIDYITISTTGDATDFGNTSQARRGGRGCGSRTRAVYSGGAHATDFGDLTQNVFMTTGVSSATRGVRGGGAKSPSPANTNVMDYVTIATTGNATDYGDLTTANQRSGGMSNSTRGLFSGGATPDSSTAVNSIDFITISSTGNGTDFGDYVGTVATQAAGCSDSHGGLS